MLSKRSFIFVIILSTFIIFNCNEKEEKGGSKEAPAGNKIVQGEGVYNLPYKLPNGDSIKIILDRVLSYFNKNTEYKVIVKETGKEITDFSKLNKNADIATGENSDVLSLWAYTMGVTYSGMIKVTEATGDKKYEEYDFKNIEFYLNHLPYFRKIDSAFGAQSNRYAPLLHTSSLDDCGSMGAALIKIYKITKDERLRPIIDHIADYISNKQFRLSDGTLARQRPQNRSVWADDSYMSVPFLAQMGSLTGNTKYYDDAVKQIIQMSKYLFRWDKRLYDHGVNLHNDYDPDIYWARANGWVLMAINELLDVLPENYHGRDDILKILRTHVQGLAEYQGGDGLWHNLLDRTDSYLETSATAMFVYSIAHSINKGWIDYTFGSVAQAGWNALTSRVTNDGEVEGTCWGTTFAGDIVYYYHRPASTKASHGYGPVLFAGAEMINLLHNNKIVIQKGFGIFWIRQRYRE
jgi:unsaturated rhamnogalacturonyl hydrolase